MNVRRTIYGLVALIVFMSYSCTEDEVISDVLEKTNRISFNILPSETMETSRVTSSDYGFHKSDLVARSVSMDDSLIVGVYIDDVIYAESELFARGAAVTNNRLASFGVYASKRSGTDIKPFFSNLNVEYDSSTGDYDSDMYYYWPGSIYTIKFMAVSPYNPQGLSVNMDANSALPASFDYTVPADAVNQNDLLLAVTSEYAGDYYLDVPLSFKHLCSAVNVKVGSIPEGSIKAITFKNIYNKGTYTLASDAWTVNNASKDDFAVDFVGTQTEYPTTGSQTGNPQINDANATFMMIPQTLPDDAEMIVSFTHTLSGKTEELSCPLAGFGWARGTTTNYLINISPYYELYIEEDVSIADCHYDVQTIHIKNEYTNKEWTLSSDQDWVKFRLMPADYETNANYQSYDDYWFETHTVITQNINYNSSGNQTGNTTQTVDYGLSNSISSSGNQVVLVYLEENVEEGTGTRSATLSLKTGDKEVSSVEMMQYYPLWNNNLAFERIEEDENLYKWGFASTRTVTYNYPEIDEVNWGGWQFLWNLILATKNWISISKRIYDSVIGDRETARSNAYNSFNDTYVGTTTNQSTGFITMTGSANGNWSATLDYGKLNNISTSGDGLANTIAILSYGGNSNTSDAETWLINNGLTKGTETSSDDNTTIPETAAYQAVMKNKWNLTTNITNTTRIIDGQSFTETTTVNGLSITDDGIQWFLPSSGEISSLIQTACDSDPNNNDESLSGSYWTSTSASNPYAYSFDALGIVSETNRTTPLKVRAVRKKP